MSSNKKIYYTATALYNNDENHSAESGVFSSEKKAMEWLEKQAKQWKEDQGIDDEDFKFRLESRKVNAYDSGTCLYSFNGTVCEAYMDDPDGPLVDVLANPFMQEEIDLFVKIAHVSKMDCWFDMEPDGRVLDYENNSGHKINRNVGLSQLIDGMTELDFGHLTDNEKFSLVKALGKALV